jgi:preprotein translocase subunit SecG
MYKSTEKAKNFKPKKANVLYILITIIIINMVLLLCSTLLQNCKQAILHHCKGKRANSLALFKGAAEIVKDSWTGVQFLHGSICLPLSS